MQNKEPTVEHEMTEVNKYLAETMHSQPSVPKELIFHRPIVQPTQKRLFSFCTSKHSPMNIRDLRWHENKLNRHR